MNLYKLYSRMKLKMIKNKLSEKLFIIIITKNLDL